MLTHMRKTLALRTGRPSQAVVLAAALSFFAVPAAHAGGLPGGVLAGGGAGNASVTQSRNQNSGHVHNNGGFTSGVSSHGARSGGQPRGKNGSIRSNASRPSSGGNINI